MSDPTPTIKSRLLLRQLKRLGLSQDRLPDTPQDWQALLERVDRAYCESDQRIELVENTLHIYSEENEARFLDVSQNVPGMLFEALIHKDGTSKLLFANQGAEEIFETPLEILMTGDFRLHERVVPELDDDLVRVLQQAALNHSPLKLEWKLRFPPDRVKWLQARSRLNALENGDLKWTGVILDISAQKEAEAQLEIERVKAIATSKMAALGEMAGGIAHEINNPLAVIQGNARIISEILTWPKLDMTQLMTSANKIAKTTHRISSIIRGLRAFARDGTGDPISSITVRTMLENTLEFCRARFAHNGVLLEIGELPDCSIECQEVQISQVLLNLLNNAFDATQDLPEKWIRLSVKAEPPDWIAFTVTDSGNGIPAAILQKIMQPFFTTKETGRGTGLGLSLSKGIVDQHAGTLTVDTSCPNTCFVLRLPRSQSRKRHQAA